LYSGQVTTPTSHSHPLFQVTDLQVSVDDHPIVKGLNLRIGAGEVHVIMGPNGSGKSTLANALMGNEAYSIDGGSIAFNGNPITDWPTDERAKSGVFLAFQYPEEIPGVTVINFLRQALSARKGIDFSILELRLKIREWMSRLEMDPAFADRYLNEGFSGGEKKRNEVLQMAILEPEIAILDETDSGLDIDALRIVAKGVQEVRADRPNMGVLLITHYQRLLDYLTPDQVHVLVDGRIVASGGPDLARKLEQDGYDAFRQPAPGSDGSLPFGFNSGPSVHHSVAPAGARP
jgi:Fe-S cluster assembly ATP-binding protein